MIDLDQATVVGRGCRRVVYVHPEHPDRCIKVQRAEMRDRSDRQKALERERHYLSFYERTGRAMDQLTRYLGEVQTSEGAGDVFELVRSYDGTIARTLDQHLEAGSVGLEGLRAELEELRRYLVREAVVVADLHAGNLARQELQPGRWRLVVIDGIGNNEFVKVSDCFRAAARRKVRRKWNRVMAEMRQKWGNEPISRRP